MAVKFGILTILLFVLSIPLMLIGSLGSERQTRRDAVVEEVARSWGGRQQIGGPILSVPYTLTWREPNGTTQRQPRTLRVQPALVEVAGVLAPEVRQRSLYVVPVYRTTLRMTGTFVRPDVEALAGTDGQIAWGDATVAINVSDPHGLSADPSLRWNGEPFTLMPGGVLFPNGISAKGITLASIPAGTSIAFSVDIDLKGTDRLQILPTGSTTRLRLQSPWRDPGFIGAALPDTSRISDQGFAAEWRLSRFSTSFPVTWHPQDLDESALVAKAHAGAVGVQLVTMVDMYQQTERATKYGFLFIVLTFVGFLLVEQLQRIAVHPLQYFAIGLALCVFFLLLLSFSEHIGFTRAYICASGATIALIGTYATSVLKGIANGIRTAAMLAGLYSTLYVLLQLEDYALLVGSLLVFTVLATVMYMTRRIDWYQPRH